MGVYAYRCALPCSCFEFVDRGLVITKVDMMAIALLRVFQNFHDCILKILVSNRSILVSELTYNYHGCEAVFNVVYNLCSLQRIIVELNRLIVAL